MITKEMLERIQKNYEPVMLKFLRDEGIIQKGKKISFEWRNDYNGSL